MLTRVAQYIRRCLPATISKKHIAVFLILFVSLSIALFAVDVRLVHAQTMLDSVASGILNVLTKVALFFARLCMAMAIFFLRFFIQLGAYNGFLDAPIVRLGWVMLRDIANMFFVVALLVIAFATILGRESYEWKKAMVKLVLVAIVVNFSLLICGVVLDAAHVFTVTFINAIAPVAAGNLITMFNFDSMQSIVTNTGGGQAGDFDLALFGGAAMALFFSALAALTIGAYCVILLYRMVAIWSLLIFSPLAFVLSVLPATENYFEEWKSEFTKNVLSAPIAVFFLWLAFATMGANSAVEHLNQYSSGFEMQDVSSQANGAGDSVAGGIGAEQTGTNSVSINAASTWAAMAGFLVAMAFLLKGIEQVQSLGVHGSGWLDSAQSFAKNVATIGSGVALGGWLLGKGRDMTANTAKNIGLSVGTQTGVIQGWKRVFTGKGFFAGAGQAAEGRLHLLEQEKEKKEAMNRALGVQGKGGLFGTGFAFTEGAHKSLAEQTVLAENEEHAAHGKEEETKIETEREMREGKYGEKIKGQMNHAIEHDIVIKQKQDALEGMKTNLKQTQTKKMRDKEDVEKVDAYARAIIDGSATGVSEEQREVLKAALQARSESSKEIEKAKKALEKAKRSGDAEAVHKAEHDLEHAIEHDEEHGGSYAKAQADVEEALEKAQKEMDYVTRRENDEMVARPFVMSDAAVQKLKAKESAGDEKDALEGLEGSYDVAYSLTEQKEIQKAFAEVEQVLAKKALETVKDEILPQKIKEAQDDVAAANKLLVDLDTKISEANRNDDKEEARRLATQRVSLQKNVDDKVAVVDGLKLALLGTDATRRKEKEEEFQQIIKIGSADGATDEQKKKAEHASGSLQSLYAADQMALDSITPQERALAYKKAGIHKKFVKYGGEVYAREQQKQVAKAKSLQEIIAATASDAVRGVESKPMDELDEKLTEKANKVTATGSRYKDSFDLHVKAMSDRFREIRRLREKEAKEKLSDVEADALKNATQDIAALFAGGMSEFKGAFGAVLQLVDGLGADGVSLDDTETFSKTFLAASTGANITDVLKKTDEELVEMMEEIRETKFKDKKEEIMVALRNAANRTGLGHYNNQFAYGYDEFGHRKIGLLTLAGRGLDIQEPGGKGQRRFTTGTTQDGVTAQEDLAISNVYGSQTLQKIPDVRSIFATGKNFGISTPQGKRMEAYARQLALIASGQVDIGMWRRLGGGSGDNGAYLGDGKWEIREAGYVEYFAEMVKGWNDILHDPNKTKQEHQDVEKRIRNMLSANGVTELLDGTSITTASAEQMADFIKGLTFDVRGTDKSAVAGLQQKFRDINFKAVNSKNTNSTESQGSALTQPETATAPTVLTGGASRTQPTQPVVASSAVSNSVSQSGGTQQFSTPQTLPQFLAAASNTPVDLFASGAQIRAFNTFKEMRKQLEDIADLLKTSTLQNDDMQIALDGLQELGISRQKTESMNQSQLNELVQGIIGRVDGDVTSAISPKPRRARDQSQPADNDDEDGDEEES